MINIRNITKVLLMAMFICVCSFDVKAQGLLYGKCDKGYVWDASQSKCVSTNLNTSMNPNTKCAEGYYWSSPDNRCRKKNTSSASSGTSTSSTPSKVSSSNTSQDATFCGSGKGVFSELVLAGQKIFNRLRDLIYVVAGFGIIAVAVGGFFGNLNWKWLGAIVISLIVIASAGELIVLLTGCEQYGTTLITNTLEEPTVSVRAK